MKNLLITGGAGFIGSNLCEFFVEDHKVRCLDNLSTGHKKNIEQLLDHPNFEFVEADITDFDACLNSADNIDFVFHQAALGSVPRSIENPLATNEANVTGFLNMIEASRKKSVKRFIYAASSSVYGDNSDLPKEEEKTGKPLSPYAVSKVVNELYAKVYSDLYDLDTIGLRYFNVFGKNQDPNGAYAAVIPKFIRAFQDKKDITIHGDGVNRRDFTHISNVVLANVLAMQVEDPQALNRVYNIAYGDQTTINELVEIIKENLRSAGIDTETSKVHHGPKRKGDIVNSYASIKNAGKYLGYVPEMGVKEGINKYVNWLLRRENK